MVDSTHVLPTHGPGPPASPGNDTPAFSLRRSARLPKLKLLHVLSSVSQLYSGIGRNLFELTLGMTDRVTFEFAIDDYCERNVNHLLSFCEKHGFRVHVGTARIQPESLDSLNSDLPRLLARGQWDVIECLCWANSGTNAAVLEGAGNAVLAYTPHTQPIWTVPMTEAQAANTSAVHHRVLQRADVVFCDSAWERRQLQDQAGQHGPCVFLPIGCHFEDFRPGPLERRPQLLFVGDLAEPRKRIDRVSAVFARLLQRRPQLRLVLVGNRTEDVRDRIPAELHSACDCRGYVSEQELRQAYAESLGVLLLSDYEAFGIPILEALASGTPVFLSRLEATQSIFQAYTGAHFCPADDLEGTLSVIEHILARGPDAILDVIKDREALRDEFNWEALAAQKWNALVSAWYQKRPDTMSALMRPSLTGNQPSPYA
jgi:glycosyltransferase involved in cell wall biosynthesis